jgi:hypothetical protein
MRVLRSLLKQAARIDDYFKSSDRYVDIALRFKIKGKPVYSPVYGGRWDKLAPNADGTLGRYIKDQPQEILTHSVSEAQFDALTNDTALHLLVIGGRRSGKTETLVFWIIKQMVIRPGLPLSIMFKKMGKAKKFLFEKLLNQKRPKIPRYWLKPGSDGIKRSPYELGVVCINGAKVDFISADRVDSPRGDGVAALGCDERQIIKREAWDNAFLSVSEGGDNFQTVETATALQGEFQDYYDECCKDKEYQVYTFKSRDNPFISHKIFDRARQRLDPRRYAQEVEGLFTPQDGLVYWNFDKELHVKHWTPIAAEQDVTRELCAKKFNYPDGEYLIGVDYGIAPFSCVIYKYLASGLLWQVDELILDEDGDARVAAKELKDRGYFPAVVIDDASDSRHGPDGKRWFKRFGFKVTSARRNPHVEDRCAAVRARLQNFDGDVNIHVDPRCKRTIFAYLAQAYDKGKPDKESGYDHIMDAAGYPVYRLFPIKDDYEKQERIAA